MFELIFSYSANSTVIMNSGHLIVLELKSTVNGLREISSLSQVMRVYFLLH